MSSAGDRVRIKHAGFEYSGILLESKDDNIFVLKLSNGYNVGIPKGNSKVTVTGNLQVEKLPELKAEKNLKLPNVSLVSTGGTITSRVDYRTGAVHPITKPAELLSQIPELKKIANISVTPAMSKFSEEFSPDDWSKLAGFVGRELNKENVRGVIVTHGTDTLHYTAAALSFALEGLGKPVAIVGGQRSSDRGSFDGAMNLICGTHYANSDIAEVATVLHGTSSDDYCIANPGTKTKKMHTTMRNTFRPINSMPYAKLFKTGKIEKLRGSNLRHAGEVNVQSQFEEKVALIKYHPGLSPKILDFYVKEGYRGVIIEGTGLGHVSANTWLKSITAATKKMFVGMTSQANYGKVDPYVYSTGRDLFNHGVVYLGDMLAETAIVKLSWVLGQEKDKDKVRDLMTTNLRGELSEKSVPNGFLY
ncbi:Glu-tRNA(Gln) amidotransferase subunit GatD [Candidatus Woesearchaeota archaeon]|jgi:glutamyl-tRNA(Gln) amidotransferase subunit D|nr:Glu-tRNA(Gln) amidotransferase subunit GatD [Candidatus Woesearchaeota archaeon]